MSAGRRAVTHFSLKAYRARLLAEHSHEPFLRRLFRPEDESDPLSATELRTSSFFPETEPGLPQILSHPYIVILGEPGAGKTWLASAAVVQVLQTAAVPAFVSLRSYRGSLSSLISREIPPRTWKRVPRSKRVLVLDGLDEAPTERLGSLVRQIEGLRRRQPEVRVILMSRQAVYADRKRLFVQPPLGFHVLGLRDDDVNIYLARIGVDGGPFWHAARKSDLDAELGNPLALAALAEYWRTNGTLGRLKSDALEHLVSTLIASRPAVDAAKQRRALRMLALAMERYSRNELTLDEARSVLSASLPNVCTEEAHRILGELTQSILLRTPSGVAFQMRSYGEYLAADELREADLPRIQRLLFFEGTHVLNDSWRSAVSYLAELNPRVRRWLAYHSPEWLLASSPAVFEEQEKEEIVTRLLDRLADRGEYLYHHPTISHWLLARFVTPTMRGRLRDDFNSDQLAVRANSLLLLGTLRDPSVLEPAIALALDQLQGWGTRHSALVAIANTGTSALIPRLEAALNRSDPLELGIIGCIGALADAHSIPRALPILLRTEALVSPAFSRFRELQSLDALEAVLAFLQADFSALHNRQLDSYVAPVWETLRQPESMRFDVAVAAVLLKAEEHGVFGRTVEHITTALAARRDGGDSVARIFFEGAAHRGVRLLQLSRLVAPLACDTTVSWLTEAPERARLLQVLALFGRPAIQARAARLVPAPPPEYVAELARVRRRNAARAARQRRQEAVFQQLIESDTDINRVLFAFQATGVKNWPELKSSRRRWLVQQLDRVLRECDCLNRITWETDTRFTMPAALPLTLQIIQHYRLHVRNDVELVQALLGADANAAVQFENEYGLSRSARRELERLFGDPATPDGALYHFMGLAEHVSYASPGLRAAARMVILSEGRPGHLRAWALRILAAKGASDDEIIDIADRVHGNLRDECESILLQRQHRPTAERRLRQLLGDADALRAGETPFPHDSPIGWVVQLRAPWSWRALTDLRAAALRLELPRVAGIVSEAMSQIGLNRLARVIRQQLSITPASWRDVQQARALEYEREANLRRAQQTPFDAVLRSLQRNTTLRRFKLWCEGPTDVRTYETLLVVAGLDRHDFVVQAFGGWNTILHPQWSPQGVDDGCHDLMFICDGDSGRDYGRANRPLRPEVRRVVAVLQQFGIDMIVLSRYAVEHYFSQAAYERVLGRALGGYFPVPEDQPVAIAGYAKEQNVELAKAANYEDMRGTDLYATLETIKRRTRL